MLEKTLIGLGALWDRGVWLIIDYVESLDLTPVENPNTPPPYQVLHNYIVSGS